MQKENKSLKTNYYDNYRKINILCMIIHCVHIEEHEKKYFMMTCGMIKKTI